MNLSEKVIEEIILEVSKKLGQNRQAYASPDKYAGCLGCFDRIEDAISAAKQAYEKLSEMTLAQRGKIIEAMREAAAGNARRLAEMAHDETGFGRVEDKILKNILAAEKTPGIEDLVSKTFTGDYGLTLVEGAPYGVIGAITPSTNPPSTVINNSISMVSAGNAVVFNPHPAAKKVSLEAIRILNEAIINAGGPENLLCSVKNPTLESSRVIMEHRDIRILAVTGGEAVVHVAMKSGKKVIAAGPGNPPVIVDNTADIPKAASDIVKGASFDNNVLCIAEKEVFVFREVADRLMDEMLKNNAYKIDGPDIEKVMAAVFERDKNGKTVINKNYVGKNASYILQQSGIPVDRDYRVILAEVNSRHPFVTTEMLMPVLPVVRVSGLEEAIQKAIEAENGCKHTAIMHSQNVSNLTKAARALDTTIFVKNAPSYAGLGFEGEGYTTLTIATPTGEGLTSARSFVRYRRCTLEDSFRIV